MYTSSTYFFVSMLYQVGHRYVIHKKTYFKQLIDRFFQTDFFSISNPNFPEKDSIKIS